MYTYLCHQFCYVYVLCSMTSSCFHGETFVCGFDNSSIHTWCNNKATTVTNKCIQTNKSYSYLSLDDYDSDNHSGVSVDRKQVTIYCKLFTVEKFYGFCELKLQNFSSEIACAIGFGHTRLPSNRRTFPPRTICNIAIYSIIYCISRNIDSNFNLTI